MITRHWLRLPPLHCQPRFTFFTKIEFSVMTGDARQAEQVLTKPDRCLGLPRHLICH
jgi:hypothetical protein